MGVPLCYAFPLQFLLYLPKDLSKQLLLSLIFFHLFSFDRTGSSLLCPGILSLRRARTALRCGAWAYCSGFSCVAQAPAVVVHGFSCSVACGIFLDQGSNPCALHWQAESYTLDHQGSPIIIFKVRKLRPSTFFCLKSPS